LQGDLFEAVESFHKALGIRRDDTFSTTMLNNVIEQLMVDEAPFQGNKRDLFLFGFKIGTVISPVVHMLNGPVIN
jgi:hypothetical protein